MAQKIIGRKKEIEELRRLYASDKPVFAVVYGRRRIGKTFLVRELLGDKFAFYHTALSPSELSNSALRNQQLLGFYTSLRDYGSQIDNVPDNWILAFDALRQLLKEKDQGQRLVVFIDELPWLDTARSGFITALEHFWNGWGAGKQNLMLIVCGSATSWISDKLLNNHGGLFDRVTDEIKLYPFTLGECEEYFKNNGIVMSRYDQVQSYMAIGGIPFYLSLYQKGCSLAQNIDNIFFARNAKLKFEFDRLYSSSFVNYEECKSIVRLLSKKRQGFTRKEITQQTHLPDGGGLSNSLKALEVSDFIVSYRKYAYPKREIYYRLTDNFSKFWLTFCDNKLTTNGAFWQDNQNLPQVASWRGFSFEGVCFYHELQIKKALGINGVQTELYPWKSRTEKEGAQIDMIIDRADNVMNICEMKFSDDEYIITAKYDKELRHKLTVLREESGTKKALHLTLVTTYGLRMNEYSGIVQKVITMDDLFG